MKRFIPYLVLGALVVAGVLLAARPLQERFNEWRGDYELIGGDTGDVMASATYQRFQARREAIIAMRQDLRRLVSAESAFIADSGHPTTVLLPPYGFAAGRGNIGPTIQITRDRWIGTMTNTSTTMMCQVTSLYDTIRERYGPGQIDCLGESAVDSAWAVAQREAAAEPPPSSLPASPERAQDTPFPPAAPTPRPHREWGPVNNRPPRMPYIAKNECEGEGCATQGLWAACSTLVAYRDARPDVPQVFAIQRGERFTALGTDVHVEAPGIITFRDTVINAEGEAFDVDSIRFIPADTLYILNYLGEGYLVWQYRGQRDTGYQFWNDSRGFVGGPQSVVVLQEAQSTSWVHVRNTAGREGWIVRDWRKMATGGYMDEIERCTQTAKG